MATVTKPIALDESFNTTELTPRNIADVLAEELSRITGRNASQVEYDNTESGLTADNVQDALDEIVEAIPTVPSVDIQTAVDEFETYNGGLLSSLKVALSPNQDLHGYSEPWVGGANVNKFPSAVAESKTVNGVTVVSDGHGTYSFSGTASADTNIDFDIEQTYTIPQSIGNGGQGCCYFFNNKVFTNVQFMFYFLDGTRPIDSWSMNEVNRINSSYSAMSGQTCNRIRFAVFGGTNYDGFKISPMFSENGLTTNPFTWWKNICPISGHTQAVVGDDGKNLLPFDSEKIGKNYTGGNLAKRYYITKRLPKGNYQFKLFDATSAVGVMSEIIVGVSKTELPFQDINAETNRGYLNINAPAKNIDITDEYPYAFFGLITRSNAITESEIKSVHVMLSQTESATFEPYNGYRVTVNLGGTYYSGVLDVVTGVFTPDTAFDTLSADNFNDGTGTSGGGLHYYDWNNGLSKKSGICLCSMMPQNNTTAWGSTTPCIQMASGGGLIRCYVEEATKEAFKTAYSGMQICYELATPTPIQLSPTMVKALVGENHLSAPLDGQEITESKYKQMFTFDDVIAYIQSLS